LVEIKIGEAFCVYLKDFFHACIAYCQAYSSKIGELHQKKDRIGERTRRTEDPIGDLFGRVEKQATAMLHKAPKDAKLPTGPSGKEQVDPRWVKDQLPSC